MPAAIEIGPGRCASGTTPRAATDWYKVAGLLVATALPTLFWIGVVVLLAKLLSIAVSPRTLISLAGLIAMPCFMAAALVMSDER